MEGTEDKKPSESVWKQNTAEPEEGHHIGMNMLKRKGSIGHEQLGHGLSGEPRAP